MVPMGTHDPAQLNTTRLTQANTKADWSDGGKGTKRGVWKGSKSDYATRNDEKRTSNSKNRAESTCREQWVGRQCGKCGVASEINPYNTMITFKVEDTCTKSYFHLLQRMYLIFTHLCSISHSSSTARLPPLLPVVRILYLKKYPNP